MQLDYTFYIGASANVVWDVLFIPENRPALLSETPSNPV